MRVARALELKRVDPERAQRYVRTVARNLIRTEYRRRALEAQRLASGESPDVVAAVEAQTTPDARAEYEDLVRAVHRVSRTALPPDLRDIIFGLLRGLSPAEIAAEQGLNPTTARTRLLRARALLRRALRSYLDEGPRVGAVLLAALAGLRSVG